MIGRVRAARRDDTGMSLVELLVAMAITTVLLAGVATVFSGTMKGVRSVNARTSLAADGRISMESISRTLRVAVKPAGQSAAIASATDHTLTFYALLNRTGSPATTTPLATFVEYGWDGTCVTEAKTPGRINSSGVLVWDTGRVSKCLVRTSIEPDFSYYIDGTTTTAIVVPTGGLTALTRQTVESVSVTVNMRDPNNTSVKAFAMTGRVTLTNVVNG